MNKENLSEEIEALEPMQQEKVARYVASLKKKKKTTPIRYETVLIGLNFTPMKGMNLEIP